MRVGRFNWERKSLNFRRRGEEVKDMIVVLVED